MAATVSVSSSICNRIYNLSFTHSSLSLTTTNFPQRPFSHKPLNLILNSQSFNLSPLSLHPPFAAALDEIEASQDNTSSQQHDSESEPEAETDTETFDRPKEDKEQNVTNSIDSGRLFVGNLPFSMTSSQLAEIFAEAGTVVSVEIVYDRLTDRSRGFAFVTMGSIEDANEAIRMFDGSMILKCQVMHKRLIQLFHCSHHSLIPQLVLSLDLVSLWDV